MLEVGSDTLGARHARGNPAACAVGLLVDEDLRVEVVPPDHGSLSARIRRARYVPYQVILGAAEAEDGTVAVRLRDGRRLDPQLVAPFVARVAALVGRREARLWEERPVTA